MVDWNQFVSAPQTAGAQTTAPAASTSAPDWNSFVTKPEEEKAPEETPLSQGIKTAEDIGGSAVGGLASGTARLGDLAASSATLPTRAGQYVGQTIGNLVTGNTTPPTMPQIPKIAPVVEQAVAPISPNKGVYNFTQALPGQVAATALTDGIGLVPSMIAGGIGSGISNAADQNQSGEVNPLEVGVNAALGAITGAAGHGIFKGIGAGAKLAGKGVTAASGAVSKTANVLKGKIAPAPSGLAADIPNLDLLAHANPGLHAAVTGAPAPVAPNMLQGYAAHNAIMVPENPMQISGKYYSPPPLSTEAVKNPGGLLGPSPALPSTDATVPTVPPGHIWESPAGTAIRNDALMALMQAQEAHAQAQAAHKAAEIINQFAATQEKSKQIIEDQKRAAQMAAAMYKRWQDADKLATEMTHIGDIYARSEADYTHLQATVKAARAHIVQNKMLETHAEYDAKLADMAKRGVANPHNVAVLLTDMKISLNGTVIESMLRVVKRGEAELQNAVERIIFKAESSRAMAFGNSRAAATRPIQKMTLLEQIKGRPDLKLVKPETPTPPKPLPPTPEGEFRFPLAENKQGRAAMDGVPDAANVMKTLNGKVDTNALHEAAHDIATKKAAKDYALELRKEFLQKIHDLHGKALKKHGISVKTIDEPVPNASRDNALRTKKFELAGGVTTKGADSLHFMMPEEFGQGANKINHIEPVGDIEKDAGVAKLLDAHAKETDKAYEASKTTARRKMFTQANKAVKDINKDPYATLQMSHDVPHPDKTIGGTVQVNTSMHQGSIRIKALMGDAIQKYKDYEDMLDAALRHPNGAEKKTYKRQVLSMLSAGGALLSADASAKAADGQPDSEKGRNHIPIFVLGAIASAVALAHPETRNKVGNLLSIIGRNTLDSFSHGDTIKKVLAPDSKIRDMSSSWARAEAAIMQNASKIKISEPDRQLGIKLLRTAQIDAHSAIDAAATGDIQSPVHQFFATMGPQKTAYITQEHATSQAFKEVVNQNIAFMEDAYKNGKMSKSPFSQDKWTYDDLKRVQKVLNGQADVDLNSIDKILTAMMSKTMEGLFRLNLPHHFINLGDPYAVGSLHIGGAQILEASTMHFDPDVRAALDGALTKGSYGGLQDKAAANLGFNSETMKAPKMWDIPSDKINAKTVTIAGALHYHAFHPEEMQALGYTSAKQFAKDLFGGRVADPYVANEAWQKIAVMNSEALGIDSMHLVSNILGSSRAGKFVAAFVQQPARTARGLRAAIRNKNYAGAAVMLGYTTAIGGSSAIPSDAAAIWAYADPDSFYAAALKLQQANIMSNVTHTDLGKKVDYAAVSWPLLGVTNVTTETIKSAAEHFHSLDGALEEMENTPEGSTWAETENPVKLLKALKAITSDISLLAVPNIKGFPTRYVSTALGAAATLKSGLLSTSAYKGDKRIGGVTKLPFEKTGMGPAEIGLRQLLGFTPSAQTALQMSKFERAARGPSVKLHFDEQQIRDNLENGKNPLDNL